MPKTPGLSFSKSTIHNINIYRESPKKESCTSGHSVKLTPTQKQAVDSICREYGMPISTFLREALDAYIDLFPYRKKLAKHRRMIREIRKNLTEDI